MGILGKFVKLTENTLALPVEAVKDVYTLGGIATEQDECYLKQRIGKLIKDAED